MKTFFKVLWNEIKTESTGKAVCGLCAIIFLVFCIGCPITTSSLYDPNVRVTPERLQAEIDNFYLQQEKEYNDFIAKAKVRIQDINEQIMFRNYIFEQSLNAVQTGGLNWLNILTGAGSIIGLGALADNVRYRIRISKKDTK